MSEQYNTLAYQNSILAIAVDQAAPVPPVTYRATFQ